MTKILVSPFLKKKTYTEMFSRQSADGKFWHKFLEVTPGVKYNFSMIDDPYINEQRGKIEAAYFDKPKMHALMKELVPYQIDLVSRVDIVAPNYYSVWQPWVKPWS